MLTGAKRRNSFTINRYMEEQCASHICGSIDDQTTGISIHSRSGGGGRAATSRPTS